VSSQTGESWVTNTGGNQLLRFPEFTTLQLNPQPTGTLISAVPPAVGLDSFDNLIVGEAANRLTFYFPKMYFRHQATYAAGVGSSPVNLTPGMLALLARYGSDFSFTPAGNQGLPWPTTGLNDVQVLVNGIAAPIFRLDPAVVYFQVPMSAPSSGTADFVVLKPSTGQILSAATFTMQQAAPGIFTVNAQGTGQAAAQNINSDGSVTLNGGGNPVTRGGYITLWLTGAGFIPGVPPDGTAPRRGDFNSRAAESIHQRSAGSEHLVLGPFARPFWTMANQCAGPRYDPAGKQWLGFGDDVITRATSAERLARLVRAPTASLQSRMVWCRRLR